LVPCLKSKVVLQENGHIISATEHLTREHLTRENSKIASSSDLFLPGRILDTFVNIKSDPPDDILEQIAILSWLPVESVQEHFATR